MICQGHLVLLAELFNKCLKEPCFPDCWKVLSVVPAFRNVGEKPAAKTVFAIRKSLWVLQKACIKIVARAIYTYLFFSYTYTLIFCWKIKSCCDHCFPQQIRPHTTVQRCIYYETILVWGLVLTWLTDVTHWL